ncbi:hypothetical protein OEZ86_003382 [Tetradesmus obliquus]|nr:hypothetical protein OEZ86_003382 [Tetradesmus obliquus]
MLWQPGWTSGCAKTLGEECEQLFSHLSRFSGTTRNQSSAGSSDALTEAALHFGRQKRAKQSLLLVQRYKKFKEQETRAEAERQLASLEQTPPQEREQLVRDLHDELRAMARGAFEHNRRVLHSSKSSSGNSSCFQLVAGPEGVSAGEQVCISYGSWPAEPFLLL